MTPGEPSPPDALLERTVIGSWSRIGYALRARHWDAAEPGRMDGRVVLVTGASSGIGEAAAEGFARLGATVWLTSRSTERAERAAARIATRAGDGQLRAAACDIASLRSVRELAAHVAAQAPRLDVLVHNAGVLTERRELSPDGIELTLATHIVGPFLLTELLAPLLAADGGGRVVTVSSGGMYARRLRVDDLQSAGGSFSGTAAYAHCKRMQVVLSEQWAARLAPGVSVNAMHPGWVDTPGLRGGLPRFRGAMRPLLRSPEQGADTIVWLGGADAGGEASGGFWLDRARRPTHLVPFTREPAEARERLWREVETLAHLGAP